MQRQYEGFWFPKSVRDEVLTPETPMELLHFHGGAPVPEAGDGTVTVRWPHLGLDGWRRALEVLRRNQASVQAV